MLTPYDTQIQQKERDRKTLERAGQKIAWVAQAKEDFAKDLLSYANNIGYCTREGCGYRDTFNVISGRLYDESNHVKDAIKRIDADLGVLRKSKKSYIDEKEREKKKQQEMLEGSD